MVMRTIHMAVARNSSPYVGYMMVLGPKSPCRYSIWYIIFAIFGYLDLDPVGEAALRVQVSKTQGPSLGVPPMIRIIVYHRPFGAPYLRYLPRWQQQPKASKQSPKGMLCILLGSRYPKP